MKQLKRPTMRKRGDGKRKNDNDDQTSRRLSGPHVLDKEGFMVIPMNPEMWRGDEEQEQDEFHEDDMDEQQLLLDLLDRSSTKKVCQFTPKEMMATETGKRVWGRIQETLNSVFCHYIVGHNLLLSKGCGRGNMVMPVFVGGSVCLPFSSPARSMEFSSWHSSKEWEIVPNVSNFPQEIWVQKRSHQQSQILYQDYPEGMKQMMEMHQHQSVVRVTIPPHHMMILHPLLLRKKCIRNGLCATSVELNVKLSLHHPLSKM